MVVLTWELPCELETIRRGVRFRVRRGHPPGMYENVVMNVGVGRTFN